MNLNKREEQWLVEEKYQGIESLEFFADLEKLRSGTPLAYLIGNIPFLGTVINLDSKPLIPRPETEYWAHWVMTHEIQNKPYKVLDIFSGSGCIGIGILKHTPCQVDFGELHSRHIEQIQKNIALNNIEKNRYQIFQSDVFEAIPQNTYDIILANPPYISKQRLETVDNSVFNHEDHTALFADDDGLLYIKKLIRESKQYLAPDGKVFVEFDPWQKESIESVCKKHHITRYSFLLDQYNKPRVFVFQY